MNEQAARINAGLFVMLAFFTVVSCCVVGGGIWFELREQNRILKSLDGRLEKVLK